MPKSIQNFYGNRVRIRVCGICVIEDSILMVNHSGLTQGSFWAPPGGGIQLSESAQDALEREFKEETHLDVKAEEFLFVTEFISSPLHAIELFFKVDWIRGAPAKGADPEMDSRNQIIKDAQFFKWDELKKMAQNEVHGMFKFVSDPAKIVDLRGYFKL